MASILRKIVAGPRAPHPEANLDLCYVTDNIIATSGPSISYPGRAYRNPLPQLVRWLDDNHGQDWAIWEFRAEGTGYPDDDVYGRIHHFPWPDHHPPPFHLIPGIMATMRDWAQGKLIFSEKENTASSSKEKSLNVQNAPDNPDTKGRVIVVHCKAGKGRSGSMAVSYLLSQEGWTRDEALQRFTDRRMRPGFGAGVSIPSQLRWIGYVERWAQYGKIYVENQIQIMEVHIWGLRDGVKIDIEGYVDEGKNIKSFHSFTKKERDDHREAGDINIKDGRKGSGPAEGGAEQSTETRNETADAPHVFDVMSDTVRKKLGWTSKSMSRSTSRSSSKSRTIDPPTPSTGAGESPTASKDPDVKTSNIIFRPTNPVYLPTNDINLAVQRRAKAPYGWMMITSVAHVWFNAFFEGNGPENMASAEHGPGPDTSGVFHVKWDHMDGISGSSQKGTRAFDRAAVVWKVVPPSDPIAPPVTKLPHVTSDLAEYGNETKDPRGSSGEAVQKLKKQATERSNTLNEGGADADAQGGTLILEPKDSRIVQEPSAAEWRGPVKEREGSAGEDSHVKELEAAADSDEDGTDGIQRGVTAAVYDSAAKVAETLQNTVLGSTSGSSAQADETKHEK